jgi:hypothetical protein
LHREKHPDGVQFWADLTNGFNEMRRDAIAQGLADMPPQLHWLRRTFQAFYSADVVLYFRRGGETYHVISQTGTVQGDPASGIFFNAGLQRSYSQLQAEFPEALFAKYLDDLNGALPNTLDGNGDTI